MDLLFIGPEKRQNDLEPGRDTTILIGSWFYLEVGASFPPQLG